VTRPGRHLLGALAAGMSWALLWSPTAHAAPVYPNLVSDPPAAPQIEDHTSSDGARRLLLRFDGFVHNAGLGALELRGDPRTGNLSQRLYDPSGPEVDVPAAAPVVYETNDQHNHWHLMRASEYSLWDLSRTSQVAPAEKVGFCLYDIDRVESTGPASAVYNDPTFCRVGERNATSLLMGVSSGWRDVYGAYLALQWVDVSSTAPGEYVLASRSDPANTIAETNEQDNGHGFAAERSVVPGHRAEPVGPVAVPGVGADVTLRATTFSAPEAPPGPRLFRVLDPPDHGTLSRATGEAFSAGAVRYVPSPGYQGPDSFTYVAIDAQSPFPRNPIAAAVTLDVGSSPAPTPLVISGAPVSLVVGTSAQLTATGSTGGGVVWTVEGVPGGSSASGTITANGLYVAPREVPPAGRVVVRASRGAGSAPPGEAAIQIVAAPAQVPAPAPRLVGSQDVVPARTTTAPLTRLLVNRRSVAVHVVPRQTGIVRVAVLTANGNRILSCTVFANAGRTVTCANRLREPVRRADLRSTVVPVAAPVRPQLGRVLVDVREGHLVARVVAGRAGTVRMRVRKNARTLVSCQARVPAGRAVTCSAPLAAALSRGPFSVAVRLKSGAHVLAVSG
jgi:Lysyl oxidase